jgi:phospholipase C
MTMRRRDAIKTLGGLAGAAALAKILPGCGTNGEPTGIHNYVFLMMENRSYDHMFGSRAFLENNTLGDGPSATVTLPDLQNHPVGLFEATLDHECDLDPPHGWTELHDSFNSGMNNGFVQQQQLSHPGVTGVDAISPMQYLSRSQVPISYALADAYATCDRWFASMMGPTYPNRFYWMTGSANGMMDNTLPSGPLTWPSIFNRIDDKKVNWAYYYGSIPVISALNAPGPYALDLGNTDGIHGRLRSMDQFMFNAMAGTLPTISYIDPFFYGNDDHPPIHPINGQELIASVYTALAMSPQWNNCMLVITYDECGGFYDHVPPPTVPDDFASAGFNQLGFRVPAMVIGPYVKQNYVSHVQYDHTSALKHLMNTFGLENLNMRTAAANDLTDCIDMDRLTANRPAPPIVLPTVDPSTFPMPAECTYNGSVETFPRKDPISDWASANQDRLGALDRRSKYDEYRRQIREFLATARANSDG